MLAMLASVGGYNFWLSRQTINEQQSISGIVQSLSTNPVRTSGAIIHYELIIDLNGRSEIFRVPVRYEPAIPAIIEKVRPGDFITVFCPVHSMPSVRASIEIVQLVHNGKTLLDFQNVRAASNRTAVVCLGGVALNIALLLIPYRRGRFCNPFKSRRFFA